MMMMMVVVVVMMTTSMMKMIVMGVVITRKCENSVRDIMIQQYCNMWYSNVITRYIRSIIIFYTTHSNINTFVNTLRLL